MKLRAAILAALLATAAVACTAPPSPPEHPEWETTATSTCPDGTVLTWTRETLFNPNGTRGLRYWVQGPHHRIEIPVDAITRPPEDFCTLASLGVL